MNNARQTTNELLAMAEEGLISFRDIAVMALKWMSENDVSSMCKANCIEFESDSEEDC
jgi:hypothetical protein